jgi:hypothetical protein
MLEFLGISLGLKAEKSLWDVFEKKKRKSNGKPD